VADHPYFLLFPGQGAQHAGMLGSIGELTEVREAVEEAEDVLRLPLGRWMREGPDEVLTQTPHAQPALLALGYGVARALLNRGLRIAGAAGHSLGEITALTVAGVFSLADGVRVSWLRGKAMQEATPPGSGAMTALLGCDDAVLSAALAAGRAQGIVVAANHNAPGHVVLSGETVAVQAAVEAAKERGVRKALPLKVSAAFHSPLMRPAAEHLAEVLESLAVGTPAFPVWSNARLAVYGTDPAEIREALVEQVTAPVLWVDQVRRMRGQAPGLEIAPAGVLKALCRRIDPDWDILEAREPDDIRRLVAA
jgi:[acyl-carrier-protein] S-malonyltransferase